MQKESNEILVDSYRAGIIDKIAKDNTTIFTNFDDFVNEAIGTYIAVSYTHQTLPTTPYV